MIWFQWPRLCLEFTTWLTSPLSLPLYHHNFLLSPSLPSDDGVVWLWHSLVNFCIWLPISSCYCSISLTLKLIGKDSGLSTLCHSCRFPCHQRVLKTFPGPGYLRSKYGVIWLWHSLVNMYIWPHHFILLRLNPFDLRVDKEGWWFEHSMS